MALLNAVPPDPPQLPEINPEDTEAKENFPHDDEWPVRPRRPPTTSSLFYM